MALGLKRVRLKDLISHLEKLYGASPTILKSSDVCLKSKLEDHINNLDDISMSRVDRNFSYFSLVGDDNKGTYVINIEPKRKHSIYIYQAQRIDGYLFMCLSKGKEADFKLRQIREDLIKQAGLFDIRIINARKQESEFPLDDYYLFYKINLSRK